MSSIRADHEHEFEPEHGLPEPLPAGERMLWQGSPRWQALAVRAFHVRKLAVYFGVIVAVRIGVVLGDGGTALQAAASAAWLGTLFSVAIGLVVLMAWLTARTTVYTLTDRRVVMRVGIVLSLTFNLPLKTMAAASVNRHAGAPEHTGDIALALRGTDRIAYLHLWPHARPWRLARPEPLLRCVPEADEVAARLSTAWLRVCGDEAASGAPAVAARPAPVRSMNVQTEAQPAMAGR